MKNYKYRIFTLYNYRDIPQIHNLPDEDIEAINVVGNVLPFKANNYVVNELINWDNIPDDPIFTLTFPRKTMLSASHYETVEKLLAEDDVAKLQTGVHKIRLQLNPNPAGQEHNVPSVDGIRLHGMQHKYRETALFFPSQSQTCHAYCTFCFRWPQFTGMKDLRFAMKETDLLQKYLLQNKEITDVLFTGGDPMTTKAHVMARYIEPLLTKEFSHIQNIRIGTKSLAYWPYRFINDRDSDEMLQLFEKVTKAGKHLAFQAHFNHPVELSTEAVRVAIERIQNTGTVIRTQSPVMKNINDNPEVWAEMWEKQVQLGLIPYYMFVARDTGSKSFFEIPLARAWQIFQKAYTSVSGISRTVRGPSMSANPGKVQVLGISEVKGEKVFVLNFLQCRNPNLVDIPFFAKYDENATWLDELVPAFGEEKFFFEENNLLNNPVAELDFVRE